MATTRGPWPSRLLTSDTVEVTVADAGFEAELGERACELVGDHDAAVAAAGAADADGEVRLALAHVRREQQCEQSPELVEERVCLGLVHHVVLYPRVGAGQRT